MSRAEERRRARLKRAAEGGKPNPGRPADQPIETRMSYDPEQGRITISYNMMLNNVRLDATAAVAHAKALLSGAKILDPDSVKGLTWE